jgi:hypothetical protein
MGWLLGEECDDQYAVTYEAQSDKMEFETRTAVFWNKREGNVMVKDVSVRVSAPVLPLILAALDPDSLYCVVPQGKLSGHVPSSCWHCSLGRHITDTVGSCIGIRTEAQIRSLSTR